MNLTNIPAVRALAKRQARPRVDLAGIEHAKYPLHLMVAAAVELAILCDLTRPESRDAIARLVAERVGLEVGATAPDFARFVCGEHCCDGERGRMVPCSRPIWSMMGADETQMVTFADCPDPGEWGGEARRHVPGVGTITDPGDALARIATHVLGDKP